MLAEERLLERALLRADDEAERDALAPFRNAQLLAGLWRRRIQIAPQHAGCVVRTRLLFCRTICVQVSSCKTNDEKINGEMRDKRLEIESVQATST